MHPRHGVEKTYEATVRGAVSRRDGARGWPRASSWTGAARPRRACACCTPPGRQSVVEIVLHEGRKRQVRRMCEAVGHPVLSLHRSAYAGLRLGALAAGRLAAAAPGGARAAAQRGGGGLTWRRRASTATSHWRASARAGASRASCAPGAWRVDGVVALEPSAAVEPGASVTLDGEPVVARRAGRRARGARSAARCRRSRIRASCTWQGPRRTAASRCCSATSGWPAACARSATTRAAWAECIPDEGSFRPLDCRRARRGARPGARGAASERTRA